MKEEDYVPLPKPEEGYTWLIVPNSNTALYVKEEDIENIRNGEVGIKAGAKVKIVERKLNNENNIL